MDVNAYTVVLTLIHCGKMGPGGIPQVAHIQWGYWYARWTRRQQGRLTSEMGYYGDG